jgi:threonylcarbamoyladenosine tRNA methylthiotransferase MtaB
MRVALQTLGCRVNEAELERWSREFSSAGHQVVASSEAAELVVLNSCAVTQEAVRKSRNLLRRIHRTQPLAKLVLSGCYATLNPSEAAALGVDLVVANTEKDRLVELVERELDVAVMPAMAAEPDGGCLLPSGRHRAFVKVQDGCRYRCTFCIVTAARGAERSLSIDAIVDEVNALHEGGVREIVLTGVHLGGYGSDLGYGLDSLVRAVLNRTPIERIRFGSLEPWNLPEALIELFGDSRLMPHLHLPLQSGCDATLRRMARRCRAKDYRELITRLRRAIPDLNITTDVIVGFPGEMDDEWNESLAFIRDCQFGHVHIFPYSRREGTKAANLPDAVPVPIQRARCSALRGASEQMRRKFQQAFIGRRADVLIERDLAQADFGTTTFGYTPNYLRVALCPEPADSAPIDRVVSIELTAVDAERGHFLGKRV